MKKRLFSVVLIAIILFSACNQNIVTFAASKTVRTSNRGTDKTFSSIPQLSKGTNKVIIEKHGVYVKYTAPKAGTYNLTMSGLSNAKTLDTEIRFATNAKSIKDTKKKDTEVVALCGSKYAAWYKYSGYKKSSGIKFRMKKGESVYIFLAYGKLLNKKSKVSCNIRIK